MTQLPRTFHIGGYWRAPNDVVRQMMLGLRAADVEVYEVNTDLNPHSFYCEGRQFGRGRFGPVWLRWEVLGPLIVAFDPELIVCNVGALSFRPEIALPLRQSIALLGIALILLGQKTQFWCKRVLSDHAIARQARRRNPSRRI
jgi:xanthosine utilization system XapX-like protein